MTRVTIERRYVMLIALALNSFAAMISSAIAFDEFLLDQLEQQSVRCAGQLTYELSCTSGLCFDKFYFKTENVTAGCASPKICTKIGCFIDKTSNTFVCCCGHSFCNGKSAESIHTRWQLFERDNYQPLNAHENDSMVTKRRSMSARDVSTVFETSSKTSTIKILPTTTTQPIAPINTTGENISTTLANINTTTAATRATAAAIPLTTITTKVTESASTQAVTRTTNKGTVSQLATTRVQNVTIGATPKTPAKSVRKLGVKVTKAPAVRANSTRSGTRRASAITRRAPYIVAKSLNATTKPRTTAKISPATTPVTAKATTLKRTTLMMTALKKTIPDTISRLSDAPTTIHSDMKLPEYKPLNPPVIKTKTTSEAAQNTISATTITTTIVKRDYINADESGITEMSKMTALPTAVQPEIEKNNRLDQHAAPPMVILPSLGGEALTDQTTLLPMLSTTVSATAPRRRQPADYRTFPWYFVVILGFAVSSAIFVLVFVLLRQFYPRVCNLVWRASPRNSLQHIKEEHSSNGYSSSVDADSTGGYAPYCNGSLHALSSAEQSSAMLLNSQKQKNESKRVSLFNAFRHSKRVSSDNTASKMTSKHGSYQRGVLIKESTVKGITSDSLASHCTTITTLSSDSSAPQSIVKSSVKEKLQQRHDRDEDRELTVIDPLLNKQYTGTIHISAPSPPLLSNGRH